LEDLRAAVAYVRSLSDIDAEAVGLYGSSLGGALALAVAADDQKIRAIALDVPAIDGLRLTPAPLAQRRALVAAVARDTVARLRGRPPVTIPVFGAVGSGAVLQYDTDGFWAAMDELDGITWEEPRVRATHPVTGEWRNEATALELLNIPRFRPARQAKDVHCAVLAHLSEDDRVVPFAVTRKTLERAPRVDFGVLRGGHFAPFYGEGFEQTATAQIAFFSESLT
jgi:dienelactone hydrolase